MLTRKGSFFLSDRVSWQMQVLKGRSQKAPIEQVALEIDLEARARVATKPAECRRVMQELAANLPSGMPLSACFST